MPFPPEPASRFRCRLLAHWPVKFAGTVAGMIAFFLGYFWVLRHPIRPVTILPLTAIDRWIPLQPRALVLYLSLWIYVSLAPALLTERRELVSYAFAAIELALAGLAIFYLWPTAVPIPDVNWNDYPTLAFLKSADASGNACPSLHVAFAVFSALWIGRTLVRMRTAPALRVVNWLWCVGIIYSTVAIRQHVAIDVLTGLPLGAAFAAIHLRRLRVAS
ncbi:MAG TPA: phosphatase PAP2 family protein [Opitutus sp.]|nr:phosphatase PAP2 family protein [Opitutus sp.]